MKKQARWPISIFICFKRASNDEHFGTFWRMPRQFLRVKLPFFIFSPFNSMLNKKISFFAIISKTRTEAYIKCGTDEFRMEKRTVWCIACICPAKSKRFEYVSFALLIWITCNNDYTHAYTAIHPMVQIVLLINKVNSAESWISIIISKLYTTHHH